MKPWIYLAIGLAALWLQLTLFSVAVPLGLKPNFLLLTVLLLGLRWLDPWLFIYGALLGLAADTFSHGIVGVYAISFCLISFLTVYVGNAIYENNLWFTVGGVAGLSLVEGIISMSLFEMLQQESPWWEWMFRRTIPLALIHGLMAPVFLYGLVRLEKALKLAERAESKP